MSPCPACGKKAVHYGVVVPWETQEAPDVLHKCACGLLFIEPAKDVPAIFAKVEWWIQGFDPSTLEAKQDESAWGPDDDACPTCNAYHNDGGKCLPSPTEVKP